MKNTLRALTGAFASVLAVHAADLPKNATPVLAAMQAELARSLQVLKAQPEPPFFLSYEVTETSSASASSAFGSLTHSNESCQRYLDIDLRVGSAALDNTHPIRGGSAGFADRSSSATAIPREDSPEAIRAVLWYQTDRKYKAAVAQLTKVKTNVKVKVEEEDKSADFCAERAEVHAEPVVKFAVDRKSLEEKVRRYTAPFAKYGELYQANASLSIGVETRWYVDSEGTRLQVSEPACRLSIRAHAKADDGMDLPRYESYFARRPEDLPSDAVVLQAVEKIIADLHALRVAPLVDPYTGPAILSGRAAGVFFHEIFGHRIEGHRQKNTEDGQTFRKQLGKPILPATFAVYCDPTLDRFGQNALSGHYLYDNQGVKARRVSLVEGGVLKGFLMARMPIEGFSNSNGHGRKQFGYAPVARQSNLMCEVAQPLSREALKQLLIEQVRQQEKPYGLFFADIEGGVTTTGRTIANAFNVRPILVYRVYLDGREELVRGVDLIGTPLTTFSKIVAANDDYGIFNGTCGAESGGVPVSSVAPGLLVSQIEVQKKAKSQNRKPILPAPLDEAAPKS